METKAHNLNWYFKGNEIRNLDHLIEVAKETDATLAEKINTKFDLFGFIYKLELLNQDSEHKLYIGKKFFWEERNIAAKKNGLPREGHISFFNRIVNHKRARYEKIKAESNWQCYESSSDIVKNMSILQKEIIALALNPYQLTYLEAKSLFVHNVLEDFQYLNANILGKFFRCKRLI
ncbi:MAG: hypothetical protein IJT59_01165 [Desulfovibrionaceae bacterium]|nr:hypothetical protein [Desulfovibrionaceae bacterium]